MPALALFTWPLAALVLFRSLPRDQALIWTALTGYLFLPEAFGIDLPLVPPVEKYGVISMTLLLVALATRPRPGPRSTAEVPQFTNANPVFGRILIGLLAILFLSPVLTILTNRTPLVFGPTVLNAMRPWDFVAITWDTLVWIVPFLLARRYLATPDSHRTLLKSLVIAGLAYSLLMLVEIRLSPQLHNWVYGYHQHSFAQHIRGGDFRPKVFLRHGLWVGMFMVMVVLAAFALARGRDGEPQSSIWYVAGIYLLAVVLLSSNLGASLLALIFVPLLFLGSTLRVVAIVTVAALFLSYPVFRASHIIPLEAFVGLISNISEERAQTFQFRLDNEENLLARANERPFAGWGDWGRNRVYDENGRDTSVTDGLWIIQIGSGGWLRYLSFFGLITLPLLALWRTRRRKPVPIETIALGLIMAANLVYLVPNSALSPIGWMMAGALAGFVQFDVHEARTPDQKIEANRATSRRSVRYSRFSKQAAPSARTGS